MATNPSAVNPQKTSQHTPGPWEAKPETNYVPAQVWTDDGRQLAEVYGEDRATRAANARLMAGAPDLLRQLAIANDNISLNHSDYCPGRDVSTCDCPLAHNWRANRAAIAKAEGGAQ